MIKKGVLWRHEHFKIPAEAFYLLFYIIKKHRVGVKSQDRERQGGRSAALENHSRPGNEPGPRTVERRAGGALAVPLLCSSGWGHLQIVHAGAPARQLLSDPVHYTVSSPFEPD
jgi:hypothetical protein